jgi:hypothetical protein
VSFIAVYGDDLQVASDGTARGANRPVKLGYQQEFRESFEFAAKYAGYHASPDQSPGAWVALRAEHENVNYQKPLRDLTGDYTFLAGRVLPDNTKPVRLAGPGDQRFGAWAVELPAGETLRVRLDQRFAESLSGKPAEVRVTWLDDGDGEFEMSGGGVSQTVAKEGTGRWQTTVLKIPSADFAGPVTIKAAADVALHMIEVVRSGSDESI